MVTMTKGALPEYKAMNPEFALETLEKLIKEIKSGEFKLVGFKTNGQNEILELPNPDGKPFTRSTGKTIKTIEIAICNQVTD